MEDNKLKGVWIPIEILQLEDLSLQEKVVLAIIEALDNEKGCIASNEYIANVIGLKARRITAVVTSLKKKGYIEVEIKNNNARTIKRVRAEQEEVSQAAEESEQLDPKEQQDIMTVKGVDMSNITAEALHRLIHRVADVKLWLKNLPMKYVKTEWKDVYQLAFSI